MSPRARPPRNRTAPAAFDLTVRLLGRRPHSELEIRQKLRRRGCASEAIEDAVTQARQLGYLDDAAFAQVLVGHRSRSRGPAVIAAELAAKGIDRELARDALGRVDRGAQVAAARKLAARAGMEDRQRMAARLTRRGFPPEVVREALELDIDLEA